MNGLNNRFDRPLLIFYVLSIKYNLETERSTMILVHREGGAIEDKPDMPLKSVIDSFLGTHQWMSHLQALNIKSIKC